MIILVIFPSATRWLRAAVPSTLVWWKVQNFGSDMTPQLWWSSQFPSRGRKPARLSPSSFTHISIILWTKWSSYEKRLLPYMTSYMKIVSIKYVGSLPPPLLLRPCQPHVLMSTGWWCNNDPQFHGVAVCPFLHHLADNSFLRDSNILLKYVWISSKKIKLVGSVLKRNRVIFHCYSDLFGLFHRKHRWISVDPFF